MQFEIPANWRRWLVPVVVLALALAGGSGVIVSIDDNGDGKPDRDIVHVPAKVAPAGAPVGGDLIVPADDKDVLKDETPENVPPAKLVAGDRAAEEAEARLDPKPVGGAQRFTCRVDHSGGLWSSRHGNRIISVKLHYTVSRNIAGWGDVYAIDSYFKRSRLGSAHRIIDFEGHCLDTVPSLFAAWTQGAFNSTSYSYEIIAYGDETRDDWLASPLIKQGILASFIRDDVRRFGLKARRVDPVGCTDLIGITDHNALECQNDHHDVLPNFPWDVVMAQVRNGVTVTSLTKIEQKLVAKRCHHYRQHVAAADGSKLERLNLGWARHYRHRIREQKHKLATNRRQAGDPWKRYHRGTRYQELSRAETGKACR